jgi:hypothetical protein
LHFIFNSCPEFASILKNVVNSEISNPISHNWDSHAVELVVGDDWSLCLKIRTKALVAFEGTIIASIDRPNEHAWYLDTLHLSSDLLGLEVDLVDQTWESNDLISWHYPSAQTDTALYTLSVS